MKTLLIFLMLLFTQIVAGQTKHVVYTNSANPTGEYNVIDAFPTSDLGKVVLSKAATESLYVTKLDANGNLIWDVAISTTGDIGTGKIVEDGNGNYAIAYSDAGQRIRLVYLDAVGALIWARDIEHGTEMVVGEVAGITLVPGAFPEFIVYGSVGNSRIPWVSHINNGGTAIWQRTYNNISMNMDDVSMNDLIVSSIGLLYAVASSPTEKYLMKIDAFGNLLTLKVMNMNMHLNSIIETSTGTLVAAGYFVDLFGAEDACLIEVDVVNMDLIDARTYGSTNDERAIDVIQNLDNSFALCVQDFSTGDAKASIYKVSDVHDFEWAWAYGGNGSETPQKVFETSTANGWMLLGSSNSFSPSADIHVVITDVQGESEGCYEELSYVGETANSIFVNLYSGNSTLSAVFNTAQTVTIKATVADTIIPFPTLNVLANHPLCNGGAGSATSIITGGIIPFTFSWSNGTSAQNLTNVLAGNYTVQMEDDNGCKINGGVLLTEPSAMITSATNTSVSCAGASDASIDLSVSGGTPGYNYSWTYNSQTTEDLSGVPGGFYQVTVTDNNGCSVNHSVSISEPTPLVAGISATVDPLCHDDCNGSISAAVSGGTSPYNYLWNDPGLQTTPTATALCSGSYLLTLTDANGCSTITSGSLQNPDEIIATVSTAASECGMSSGSAMAVVSGGSIPYQYNWPLGSILDNESGLDVGNYTVQITDDNGCSLNENFSIGSITAPVEICLVTVTDNNENLVVWEKPVASNIAGFNIYRNIAGTYTQIGYRPYDSLSQYIDTDFGVDPTITSYRYKISVIDTCGNESALSSFHETIHLTTSVGISNEVNLIWDDYEGVAFSEYEIWRDTTNLGNWELIGTVLSTNFTFVDNTVPSNLSTVRYAIDIVLPATCTSTGKATDYNSSRSNNSTSVLLEPGASLSENILENASVYPNPASNFFNIKINATNWSYELRDISGRVILNETDAYNEVEQVDVGDLEKGTYILILTVDGTSSTKRVIIH